MHLMCRRQSLIHDGHVAAFSFPSEQKTLANAYRESNSAGALRGPIAFSGSLTHMLLTSRPLSHHATSVTPDKSQQSHGAN